MASTDVEEFLKALRFDRFMTGEMTKEEARSLESECESNPSASPFCPSLKGYEAYRIKLRSDALTAKSTAKYGKQRGAVYAKVKAKKIQNWMDLRYSSVSTVIRGLHAASANDLKLVEREALSEKKCPNNIAIALAAHLEDRLPDRVQYSNLAKLYEIGGNCPSEKDSLDEVSSVRAGLFHIAANAPELAIQQLEKTRKQDKAFRARPLYWIYRMHKQLGHSDLAAEALDELKTEYPFSFHTLIALTSSGIDPGEILERKAIDIPTRSEKMLGLNGTLHQVELLQRYQFQKTAGKLIDWVLSVSGEAEPKLQLYLANLREFQGDHFGKFNILSSVLYANPQLITRRTLEQYFPKLYFPIFEKHSHGLDPFLLLAVARRESAFNPRAISSADARGLLQITPNTLRGLNFDKDLFDPESNIFVGAKYLSDLLERLDSQIHLALAGYNAGPHRVDKWIQRYPMSDPMLFIDLIPFRETRTYVAAVLRNYYWYRRIHQSSPPADHPLNPLEWKRS